MQLKVYYLGHPVLRKKGEEIIEITKEIRKLADDMIETMDANNGIGLAAPQVGQSIRMFVLRDYLESEKGEMVLSDPKVFINPKLSQPSQVTCFEEEGCLSIPGLRVDVERPSSITIEALDINGKPFKEELKGINARVRMHENDHLNGVLIIDRANAKEKKRIEREVEMIRKKYSS